MVLFVAPTRSNTRDLAAAGKVVLKVIRETALLAFTNMASSIKLAPDENTAKYHACMTAKGIMEVYPGRPCYITIANFGKVGVHLPKQQNVGVSTNESAEIVHIEDECYLYLRVYIQITVIAQLAMYTTRRPLTA